MQQKMNLPIQFATGYREYNMSLCDRNIQIKVTTPSETRIFITQARHPNQNSTITFDLLDCLWKQVIHQNRYPKFLVKYYHDLCLKLNFNYKQCPIDSIEVKLSSCSPFQHKSQKQSDLQTKPVQSRSGIISKQLRDLMKQNLQISISIGLEKMKKYLEQMFAEFKGNQWIKYLQHIERIEKQLEDQQKKQFKEHSDAFIKELKFAKQKKYEFPNIQPSDYLSNNNYIESNEDSHNNKISLLEREMTQKFNDLHRRIDEIQKQRKKDYDLQNNKMDPILVISRKFMRRNKKKIFGKLMRKVGLARESDRRASIQYLKLYL